MKNRAITLVETLVVILILCVLSMLIYPSLAKAKMASKVSVAKVNLKQFWSALELYRHDNDGAIDFGPLADMGLPPGGRGWDKFLQTYSRDDKFTWSRHRDLCPCGIKVNSDELWPGLIYFGNILDRWPIDVLALKEQSVILADKNCNDSSVRVDCQFCRKRSIGITLGGQIKDKVNSERKVWDQRFYQ